MTKQEVLKLKRFFLSRNLEIIQVCLLLDIVIVKYPSGQYVKYKLANFRNSNHIR